MCSAPLFWKVFQKKIGQSGINNNVTEMLWIFFVFKLYPGCMGSYMVSLHLQNFRSHIVQKYKGFQDAKKVNIIIQIRLTFAAE